MEFLVDIKPGSFLHQRGRARNQARLQFGGLVFSWDGRRQIYSAGFQFDLPADLLSHPALRIAGMSAPSTDLCADPNSAFDPDPPPGPKKKAKPKKPAVEAQG